MDKIAPIVQVAWLRTASVGNPLSIRDVRVQRRPLRGTPEGEQHFAVGIVGVNLVGAGVKMRSDIGIRVGFNVSVLLTPARQAEGMEAEL